MFVQARALAEATESKMLVTSRACATRFSSSQFHEFTKLLKSFPLYIKAFRKYGYVELKEYQIAGQDLIFDICAVVDILTPVVDLLVGLQNLQAPVWKICIWTKNIEDALKAMSELRKEVPKSTKNLTKHMRDIEDMQYKNTKLVPGWLVVGK